MKQGQAGKKTKQSRLSPFSPQYDREFSTEVSMSVMPVKLEACDGNETLGSGEGRAEDDSNGLAAERLTVTSRSKVGPSGNRILSKFKPAVCLVLVAAIFGGCGSATNSEVDPQIVNTGVEGSGCWYDDSRFVVLRNQLIPGEQRYETEGLYYLSVDSPTDLKPIDLTSLEPKIRRQVGLIECQANSIIFSTGSSKKGVNRVYRVVIGEPPELISEIRAGRVSTRGHYVLGSSHKVTTGIGSLQGAFIKTDDCEVSYLKAGYKALCWDSWLERRWPLENYVVMEYKWQDTIKVLGEDGQIKFIPNHQKPLTGINHKPLNYALLLRDLNNQILVNLYEDPIYRVVPVQGVVFDEAEKHIYTVCRLRDQKFDDAPLVCRYPLDGKQHQWEKVFLFAPEGKTQGSIQSLSISGEGHFYFVVAGARHPYNGILKFNTSTKQYQHVTKPGPSVNDEAPKVSPDGLKVAFLRSGTLFIGKTKGISQLATPFSTP